MATDWLDPPIRSSKDALQMTELFKELQIDFHISQQTWLTLFEQLFR